MTAAAHELVKGLVDAPSSSPLQDSEENILFPVDFCGIDDLIAACWATVEHGLSRQGYGSKQAKIHISLHEAMVNAWKHGNGKQPDLPIIFRWRFADNFTFEVQDAGQGFSYQTRIDPFTPERLTAENGRGLFIIWTCSDTVCWEKGGRLIIVTFARP